MNLFYTSEFIGDYHLLDEQESHHCIKSLRLRTNNQVYLTDGKGNIYLTQIIDDNIRACRLEIIHKIEDYPLLPYHLHIGIAPTKNTNRMEWFIEKAVETGISEITAVVCENSERTSINSNRIERLMVAAIKQSLRSELPIFNNQISFNDFIEKTKKRYAQKFIAYCGDFTQQPSLLKTVCRADTDTLILIGPEGDFTFAEVQHAIRNEFIPVSLGKFRLRTETAALLACATVQVVNGG
jgi:16S rRNA (uracil1498-N3)-methyltransferase